MAQRLRAADRNGETALHLAVREGDEELFKCVYFLIDRLVLNIFRGPQERERVIIGTR